jgi:beta-barrel assembly-enhancing protease
MMKIGSYSLLFCTSIFLILTPDSLRAQSDEERVGRAAAAQVLGAAGLLNTDASQLYLNLLGQSLAAKGDAVYRWRFGAIESNAINAFAMPGGYILVSTGLLKILENEDELAFVLAHEIAHVSRRHHYQIVLRQRLAEQASRDLQSAVQGDEIAKLASASGQIYARGLDKGAEFEADRLGVEIMTRAGYDPVAALSVLERLLRFKGSDPRAELLFSTHPSPAERLDMLLQSGLEKLPRPSNEGGTNRQARFKKFVQGL